ncbi:MAG: single-stranded-DNA-specific exonuclease RecJ [Deltaproteobacteria bacterium]|nr:single-stranded-DNA-specific exonuclease RecJ [Deltaproteobacteria bacterium]
MTGDLSKPSGGQPNAADRRPWLFEPQGGELARAIADQLNLPPVVAALVAQRVDSVAAAEAYLNPRLADLLVPALMAGVEPAARRLTTARVAGELVGVFGDYDVDGVTSAALLGDFLEQAGAQVSLRVARRDEGYGFSTAQADEMRQRGCKVVVLTDCGTSDLEAVSHLAQHGIDVIAVDHHRLDDSADSWPGLALINPHQPSCGFEERALCSAGLAFYLAAVLRRQLQQAGLDAPDPRLSLDLVALGTLADVAELSPNNRILVRYGLEQIARTRRPGLQELLRLAELDGKRLRADDVGWRLGPRLNAPGRLGDAGIALEALYLRDEIEATERARRCHAINEERKAVQRQIFEQAREQADRRADDPFCLVADDGWHPGVIGIVASKLAETYGRPAAVIAWEGDRGRASARSVPGVDLFALLAACSEHLLRFGGHAAAAGFSIRRENLEAFRTALCQATAPRLVEVGQAPVRIQLEVELRDVDQGLLGQLERLEPFGNGNPQPTFSARQVTVDRVRRVGQDHLGLVLRQGDSVRHAIGFQMADQEPAVGAALDIAFVPEIDSYYGPRLRLRLVALRPAETRPTGDL